MQCIWWTWDKRLKNSLKFYHILKKSFMTSSKFRFSQKFLSDQISNLSIWSLIQDLHGCGLVINCVWHVLIQLTSVQIPQHLSSNRLQLFQCSIMEEVQSWDMIPLTKYVWTKIAPMGMDVCRTLSSSQLYGKKILEVWQEPVLLDFHQNIEEMVLSCSSQVFLNRMLLRKICFLCSLVRMELQKSKWVDMI